MEAEAVMAEVMEDVVEAVMAETTAMSMIMITMITITIFIMAVAVGAAAVGAGEAAVVGMIQALTMIPIIAPMGTIPIMKRMAIRQESMEEVMEEVMEAMPIMLLQILMGEEVRANILNLASPGFAITIPIRIAMTMVILTIK